MRIQVRCPSCGRPYEVEESALPRDGGEMTCLECGVPFLLPAPTPQLPPDPAGNVGSESSDPAAVPAGKSETAPRPVADEDEEVVCPRCGLHFVPRRVAAVIRPALRRTVLVVEDMEYFRDLARQALQDRYRVRAVSSAREAREALAEGGVDLLVLDLTLEGPDDGLQLLREFARKPCPVLLFTAQDESEMYGETWDELRSLGADDMVIKGMNVGESLRRKAAELLGEPPDDE